MAIWRQQGRHKTGTTGGNSLHPTQQWMGNITEWSGYGYVEATRKTQDRNYWRKLITSDPAMDGEHDRVVRVWLCGGNKEGTRQELLATTHYIRPSNGCNLTTIIEYCEKEKTQVTWIYDNIKLPPQDC